MLKQLLGLFLGTSGAIALVAFLLFLASAAFPDNSAWQGMSVVLVAAVVLSVGSAATYRVARQERRRLEREVEQIEVKAEKEPGKAKFAWDLARVKLEAYFDRNLMQVFMIFPVAIVVMLVGFGFVLWGVRLAIADPRQSTSWIAAISGVITEFIGVTFMVIYRSTMAQANSFMEVLERINTVGMAVQILDSIPDAEAQLKNTTRAELVALLLSNGTRFGNKESKP
jgi:hypothetical protein